MLFNMKNILKSFLFNFSVQNYVDFEADDRVFQILSVSVKYHAGC